MAVEEQTVDEPVRSYSTEKQDIEKIEQVADISPHSGGLQNRDGESVSVTWKTWAVIFVSLSPSRSYPRFLITFRFCHPPSGCPSGLSPPLPLYKRSFPSLLETPLPWLGMFPPIQQATRSDSCSLEPTRIFLVDVFSCSSEMLLAASDSSSPQPQVAQANSLLA